MNVLMADEYIIKSFDPRVLLLRSKKLIGYSEVLNIGKLKIDFKSNRVYKDGKEISLIKKELELMKCLADNKGIILSREKLLNLVWGLDYYGDDRTVDTHIRILRSKELSGTGLGLSIVKEILEAHKFQ